MKQSKSLTAVVVALGLLSFSSCKKDDTKPTILNLTDGAFIVNEGNFGSGNGSISFYNFKTDSVTNNVFNKANGSSLGDVVQSMTDYNGKGYIVVNNSNKIEVINDATFKSLATISNVTQPRYMIIVDSLVYVSTWGNSTVAANVTVISLATNTIKKTIPVGNGPEKMIYFGSKVYVANGGGLGVDSTVSVIDPTSQSVVGTIAVSQNPKALVIDNTNKMWVLCAGSVVYNTTTWAIESATNSALQTINISTNAVTSTINLGNTVQYDRLGISSDNQSIYYGSSTMTGIYKIAATATTAPTSPFIGGSFYGFSVNPSNGEIYGFTAPSFTTGGTLSRYNSAGTLIKSYTVGIGPSSATF